MSGWEVVTIFYDDKGSKHYIYQIATLQFLDKGKCSKSCKQVKTQMSMTDMPFSRSKINSPTKQWEGPNDLNKSTQKAQLKGEIQQ